MSLSPRTILELENINLVFRTKLYRHWNLRDVFINALKSPFDLVKTPERHHVLQDVSLTIREGEKVGLIGVNGAGKTSLCRCIAKVYVPQSGKVKTYGAVRPIFDTAVGLYPELSGRENAILLIKFMYPELSRQEQEGLLQDIIDFSELKHFIDAPYRTYSNGMQARLGLSLISARPSDLLIMDEVFDGADTFFREKISLRVKKLIEASGAVLFVSHTQSQIEEVCERVVFLHEGKIAYDGPLKEGFEMYHRLGAGNA